VCRTSCRSLQETEHVRSATNGAYQIRRLFATRFLSSGGSVTDDGNARSAVGGIKEGREIA
jgi:hypothetical protein